jgi:3-oxoacyl-[acyl-carrier protein] reductase
VIDLGLAGKVALVTGAGGGIGAAIVGALSDQGCIVYAADADASAAQRAVLRHAARARPLELDVGDAQAVHDAVARVAAEAGHIDVLVNGAGILRTSPVADASVDDWDAVCRVNLSGVWYCSKAVLSGMLERRAGSIVNIASVSAMKGGGTFGNVLYGTTKAGVVALTKGMARELGPFGVRVNAVAPGVADTGMTHPLLTPERRAQVAAAVPLGRMAMPEEIARVVTLLASEALAYVTGITLPVDGGYLTR